MSRRVRVTVEGDATESPANGVLRVYVGASRCVMVDPSWQGVMVEELPAERVWTDGDVIDHKREVWVRAGGVWRTTTANRRQLDDAAAELTLLRYPLTTALIRYQAGE